MTKEQEKIKKEMIRTFCHMSRARYHYYNFQGVLTHRKIFVSLERI